MDQHTALVKSVRDALNTGVSMRGLAKQAGVSHATISKLLSDDAVNVSLKTYQKLMAATGGDNPWSRPAKFTVNRATLSEQFGHLDGWISELFKPKNDGVDSMKKPVTTHDHASASLAQIEQAALDRGMNDVPVRDTELECAKYRRVMALEAELDAWQLKCGKERDKSEQLQNELRKTETLAQACSKDLQVMSASWKAVSVERDNLERNLSQREQHLKSCENALIEAQAERDGLKLERDNLHDQLEKADIAYTTLHRDASYAKYVAWACCIASLLIVLQAAFVAFGGAV